MRKVVMLLSVVGVAACFGLGAHAAKVKETKDPNQRSITGYLIRSPQEVLDEKYLGTKAHRAKMKKYTEARKKEAKRRKIRAFLDKVSLDN